jgi:hypothetical protein
MTEHAMMEALIAEGKRITERSATDPSVPHALRYDVAFVELWRETIERLKRLKRYY